MPSIGWSGIPYLHGESNNPPTQEAKGRARAALDDDPQLIFESVEDFIDRELQQSEAFHRLVVSEQARGKDRDCLLLVSGLPSMSVWSMVRIFVGDL